MFSLCWCNCCGNRLGFNLCVEHGWISFSCAWFIFVFVFYSCYITFGKDPWSFLGCYCLNKQDLTKIKTPAHIMQTLFISVLSLDICTHIDLYFCSVWVLCSNLNKLNLSLNIADGGWRDASKKGKLTSSDSVALRLTSYFKLAYFHHFLTTLEFFLSRFKWLCETTCLSVSLFFLAMEKMGF